MFGLLILLFYRRSRCHPRPWILKSILILRAPPQIFIVAEITRSDLAICPTHSGISTNLPAESFPYLVHNLWLFFTSQGSPFPVPRSQFSISILQFPVPYFKDSPAQAKLGFLSFSDKLNNLSLSQDISNNFRSNLSNKLQVNNIPERRKTFNRHFKIEQPKGNENVA